MNRLEVRDQVISCQLCHLHLRCRAPVPFSGPTPATVAVMGEAPGREEDARGKPFMGPAGQLLRRLLELADFSVDQLVFINTVCCFPLEQPGGRGRTPSPLEVKSCAGNREAQLMLADPDFVLLTGNVPLRAYRPDLRIGRARGRPFTVDARIMFAVYHPAAVLRNPAWEKEVLADLQLFRRLTREDWTGVPTNCIRCGKPEAEMAKTHVDAHGLPWCEGCVSFSPTHNVG